jgi:penicillin-binding protein 1A
VPGPGGDQPVTSSPVHRISWPFRAVAVVLAGAFLLTGVTIGVAPRLWALVNAHDEQPIALPPFQPLSQRSYVYDALGNVIAIFERENSQPIKLEQIPPDVIAAFLAVEDNEFWLHNGVNVRGFARALFSNFSGGGARQGASTITQQVVKNEYLAGLPRDGRYKVLQSTYAVRLEKQMSKAEILTRYLNTVFLGNNAYGLQAASETYFGKNVEELSMLEGAFLAGLVRSPSQYEPINNPYEARARFLQVTERLSDVGLLTEPESLRIGKEWPLPERTRRIPSLTTKPTYYTEALRDYLLTKSNILGTTEQERANQLYRGGLRIHTTLRSDLQLLAEQARNVLPPSDYGFDAALVSLDTRSGAILTMVGGREFDPQTRAINMALTPRQTGSSIKIFILAAAYQAGVQANDVIDGTRGCRFAVPDQPDFAINGGVSGGVFPMSRQTALSVNCAFVRLSQVVGLNRVVDTTYRMSSSVYLYKDQPREERRPIEPFVSFGTGANEMSPMDMAAGMQTIANQGVHHEPYYVEFVDRADGVRLYTHVAAPVGVLDPGVALNAIDTMKGVLSGGTARRALSDLPFPASGKTGTQEDNTNAWFVGSTPQITTAVWVGDPNRYTPMMCGWRDGERICTIESWLRDLGDDSVTGGTYPARIWEAFMVPAVGSLPLEDWPAPPANPRKAVRLYLPGNECLAKYVSGPRPGSESSTTVAAEPTTPPTDPATGSTLNPPAAPTTAPRLVLQQLPSGTTVPPNVLDPRAPVPSTDLTTIVYACARPPANSSIRD